MSIKTKLTSLITTFVLLCSLLTVGVFAVKNTSLNVGGDIVFNVQGIEATITRGDTAGFTSDKTIGNEAGNILSNITLNNDMSAQDVADAFAPWSGLNLAFSENVATIKLTITNTAEEGADNYLDISAIASATTKNNARVSVVNDAGGVTALLQPQQSASFTITFSVIDDEYSANLEGFSVNFDMQKKALADFPKVESIENEEDLLDQYEFSEYSTSAPYTVAIAAKGASAAGDDGSDYTSTLSGDIVVPSYVNKDGIIYAVTKLANGAFGYGPPDIVFDCTSITLPKTLTTFGHCCFYTTNPLSIEIPYGVISIGDSAFYDGNLASITIPDTVTSIGSEAFCQCYGVSSIIIPDSVISIGSGAFQGSDLTSITIPSSVTSIGYCAFSGCSDLTSITIPSSVTSIGEGAFEGCESLTGITIPDGVTSIGSGAFYCCENLISITIPFSVTSIEECAFEGCNSLTTVNYRGTEEQWNVLLENIDNTDSLNDYLINATINFI